MSKAVKAPLHKALTRTYWSVDDAMYYLIYTYSERNLFQLIDVGRTTEASNWQPDELYSLWRDTDHSQQPRNSVKTADPHKDEYEISYFVKWAKSKGLRIAWLPWAIAEKLLPPDIGQQPTVESESAGATSLPKLHPKRELTQLVIIGSLLHHLGIDTTSRDSNAQVRRLVNGIGEELHPDTIRAVFTALTSDEAINAVLSALRNKVEPL